MTAAADAAPPNLQDTMRQQTSGRHLPRRRVLQFLAMAGGVGLAGCVPGSRLVVPQDRARFLAPLRAGIDRLIDITVCLRPFRAAGPRLDAERIRDTLVVHNYGHGGSGWSLSWGSSSLAVGKALSEARDRLAVVGCGALGLTSALLAQEAGRKVTIYTREPIQKSWSLRASGSFTPDSRIALTNAVGPEFPALWEDMARHSLKTFNGQLGLAGDPIRWVDRYIVNDQTHPSARIPEPGELPFASYGSRLRDALPRAEQLAPADTPFRAASIRRRPVLVFNLSSYAELLMNRFRMAGGQLVLREFHEPVELAELPEKVVIDCTGFGARTLWRDHSIVPIRGQLAHLVPQPEVDYAIAYRDVNVIPRSDGIVVQAVGGGDMRGYGEDSLTPDRAEVEDCLQTLAGLYRQSRRSRIA